MSSDLDHSTAYRVPKRALSYKRWLRAGFIGFAYRLAHLHVSRSTGVLMASALFYLA